jgi:DNA repair photolyase
MNVIYEPKGRAREYAALACNIYTGCDHNCVYCYAPNTLKKTREVFAASAPRDGFIEKLKRESARQTGKGQVLLCFTCDPYQHLDEKLKLTRETIQILHANKFNVCVLTKGGERALRDLDLFTPRDAFATTLTTLDDATSREWEPDAALPYKRIIAIHRFYNAGIPTWVSLEPVYDPASALEIIRDTHDSVDLFKVGKLNYHPRAKEIDWSAFARASIELLESLGYARTFDPDETRNANHQNRMYYIKRDLAQNRFENRGSNGQTNYRSA